MRIIFISICFVTALTISQDQNWELRSLPGTKFSIETPVPLLKVPDFEGEQGVGKLRDEDAPTWVSYYAGIQSEPIDRQFGIVVYDIPSKERRRVTPKMLEDLQIVVGDDDTTPTRVKEIQVNGLTGKEYTYSAKNDFDVYTRGRILYTGKQIFIVVFRTRKADDLGSRDAERFLNSFCLRN